MSDQSQPNATDNDRLTEILKLLTTTQIRFVIARTESKTDKEAAETIGISPATAKGWNDDNTKALIDEAVRLMIFDGLKTAKELRRRNLAKAMAVKVSGLDSDDEQMRQKVSTEIIEWEMGKAQDNVNVDGKLQVIWNPHKPSTGES